MSQFFGKEANLKDRWFEIKDKIQLKSSDYVRDIGCAEGDISFYIADEVEFIEAIESDKEKLHQAIKKYHTCPYSNINWTNCKIENYEFSVKFDVTLYMGVHNKIKDRNIRHIVLKSIFAHTKRLIVIRTYHEHTNEILDVAAEYGFLLSRHESVISHQGPYFLCRKFYFPI